MIFKQFLNNYKGLLQQPLFKSLQNGNKCYAINQYVRTTNFATASSAVAGEQTAVLYSFWHSSCSWRVRIALNFKGIPYDIKPIALLKSAEHRSEEYQKINPMQKVPALRIDDCTFIESLAIMEYLEETRPQPSLLPQDALKRAKVREICQFICSGIQPLQNVGLLVHLDDEIRLEWAQQWINQGFRAVEKVLSTSAGKYCVGDEITMADCCLVPQVFNARKFLVGLDPYPTIVRINRELEANPAFSATHPAKQPDCPPEFSKI